jgi:hypothetical protein
MIIGHRIASGPGAFGKLACNNIPVDGSASSSPTGRFAQVLNALPRPPLSRAAPLFLHPTQPFEVTRFGYSEIGRSNASSNVSAVSSFPNGRVRGLAPCGSSHRGPIALGSRLETRIYMKATKREWVSFTKRVSGALPLRP